MYDIYVIDKDICPQYDNVIQKGQCRGCNYYKGFKMHGGQPCIYCECCYAEDENLHLIKHFKFGEEISAV